jgi:DNA-binding HxlR family transcriptional regulator
MAVPPCPVMADRWGDSEPVVRLLAGRWTLAVLGELAQRSCRYQDLHTALGGISHKVLTDTLRRAERDGLVARTADRTRVETAALYQLTDPRMRTRRATRLARPLGQPELGRRRNCAPELERADER